MIFDPKACGERIRSLRKKRRLTQEQFSAELNITTDHLGKFESGKRGISIDLLVDISEALDVSLDYLIKGKSNRDVHAVDFILEIRKNLDALEEIL